MFWVLPLLPLAWYVLSKGDRASQSWIEVSPDGSTISVIPSRYARILGEAPTILSVPPRSTLLFCRDVAYGFFDKYCIVLRGPDGEEQPVWSDYQGRTLSYVRCSNFSEAVQNQCGLRVLLLNRSITESGTTESEWIAQTGRVSRKMMGFKLAMAPLPYLGIVLRLLTANTTYLIGGGVVIWTIGVALLWIASRVLPHAGGKSDLGLAIVYWSLWLTPWYAGTIFVTGAFLER